MVKKSIWNVYAPLDRQAVGFLLYCPVEVSHCPQKRQFQDDLHPNNRWNSLVRMYTTAAFLQAWHIVKWQPCRANRRPGLVHKAVRSDPEFRLLLAFHPSTLRPLLLRFLFFRSLHLETMSLVDSRHKFSDFRCLGNFSAWVILQEQENSIWKEKS